MSYGPVVTTLKVASIKNSLEFYTNILGFSLKWSWSDNDQFEEKAPPDFACVESGEAVLFLSENNGSTETWLFVEIPSAEDFDRLSQKFDEHTVMVQPPTVMPWGSLEFIIKDPDGHRLRFSCPTNRNRD